MFTAIITTIVLMIGSPIIAVLDLLQGRKKK